MVSTKERSAFYTLRSVLELLKKHRIVPLFVPAKCTDVLSEMDVAVNKPFKMGMKAAFRDYLHNCFDNHLATTGGEASTFRPKLGMLQLKPQMVHFVETGMATLRTPEFKETLRKCFAENGCFREMPPQPPPVVWKSIHIILMNLLH